MPLSRCSTSNKSVTSFQQLFILLGIKRFFLSHCEKIISFDEKDAPSDSEDDESDSIGINKAS